MSAHSADHANSHLKIYYGVLIMLLVFTAITVGVALVHIPSPWHIVVGLIIALIKGSAVAAIFMHLTTERKPLFAMLLPCVLFFLVLLVLPVLSTEHDMSEHWKGKLQGDMIVSEPAMPAGAGGDSHGSGH